MLLTSNLLCCRICTWKNIRGCFLGRVTGNYNCKTLKNIILLMYQENPSSSPKNITLDVGAAISQVASFIPLKVFRKQGLSEVMVISERTLSELIEKTVDTEVQKRFEDLSRERDELRMRSEDLSRQLEEFKEGSGNVFSEREELEKNCRTLEEEITRLRSKLDAERVTFRGAASAQTSITKEEYEQKIRQVVENILEGAKGTMPVDLFDKLQENLSDQLIDKFPHTTSPLRVAIPSETTVTGRPRPAAATSGAGPAKVAGPVKVGSLFHKLVESNIKWRDKQRPQEQEEQKEES